MPFEPRSAISAAIARPISEASGRHCGSKASSPASIPAHGTKPAAHTAPKANGEAFPKSASTAARYPPYFLPRARKSAHINRNAAEDMTTGSTYPSQEKKRTSSAPEINPAPIHVPTIKKVAPRIPIFFCYENLGDNMSFREKIPLFMTDIVL